MANTAQAKKRVKQNEKHRRHNASLKSKMRTHLKRVSNALDQNKADLAQSGYSAMVSVVDKLASQGLIHKNKAARHKSRLNARLKRAHSLSASSSS